MYSSGNCSSRYLYGYRGLKLLVTASNSQGLQRRYLYGYRGLKLPRNLRGGCTVQSISVWISWIEIKMVQHINPFGESISVWISWIEIPTFKFILDMIHVDICMDIVD